MLCTISHNIEGNRMKRMSSKEYAALGGPACPQCRSPNLWCDGRFENTRAIWDRIGCNDCGAAWVAVYVLQGYVDFQKGDVND
jgi:hypothetical protein